jgi:hypothetical protein
LCTHVACSRARETRVPSFDASHTIPIVVSFLLPIKQSCGRAAIQATAVRMDVGGRNGPLIHRVAVSLSLPTLSRRCCFVRSHRLVAFSRCRLVASLSRRASSHRLSSPLTASLYRILALSILDAACTQADSHDASEGNTSRGLLALAPTKLGPCFFLFFLFFCFSQALTPTCLSL